MFSNDSPRTTQRVLEEDPNMGKQVSIAACLQPSNEGYCVLRNQHKEAKKLTHKAGSTKAYYLNSDFEK